MISYQEEPLTPALIEEIKPLLQDHQDEVGHFDDVGLNIQWDTYLQITELGIYRFFTVREEGRLVGYAGYIITPHMMYGVKQAVNDTIFLHPDHRNGRAGRELIAFSDTTLEQAEVYSIGYHVENKKDFGPLLRRMGYEAVSVNYLRRVS